MKQFLNKNNKYINTKCSKAIITETLERSIVIHILLNSFQSEVFIFRGGNDHNVSAPEVPNCCEMEGHVGEDHQILKQSEKCVTCEEKIWRIDLFSAVKKNNRTIGKDQAGFILTPGLTVHVVFPEEESRKSAERDI